LWIIFSFGFFVAARGLGNYTILQFSPNWLFSSAATAIMHPTARTMGTITATQEAFMISNPLSLGQSMILVWPYLMGLVCLSIVCFAISYLLFMRQEIRST
jgi:ABC-2 type transport system permease protein